MIPKKDVFKPETMLSADPLRMSNGYRVTLS